MASAAPLSRGLKRICIGCGTRFYDLEKRPIVCPSCGMEFTGDAKLKVRRSRAVAEEASAPVVEEEETEKDIEVVRRDADVVGLGDVEEDAADDTDEDADVEADLEELDEIEDDDDDLDDEIDVEVEEETDR